MPCKYCFASFQGKAGKRKGPGPPTGLVNARFWTDRENKEAEVGEESPFFGKIDQSNKSSLPKRSLSLVYGFYLTADLFARIAQ